MLVFLSGHPGSFKPCQEPEFSFAIKRLLRRRMSKECCLVLPRHDVQDFWIFPINWLVAFLLVGYDAGMCPFIGVICLFVLFRSGDEFASGHRVLYLCFSSLSVDVSVLALYEHLCFFF